MPEGNPGDGTISDSKSFTDFLTEEANVTDPEADEAEEALEGQSDAEEAEEVEDEPTAEDEEAEEEDEDTSDPVFEVELSKGHRREMSLSELVEGNMRQQDYSRKTAEIADERRELDRMKAEAAELNQRLEADLIQIAANAPSEPNWMELAKTLPPEQYQLRQAQHRQQQQQILAAQEKLGAIKAEQQRELTASLIAEIPGWDSQETRQADISDMVDVAGEFGFSAAELDQKTDAREFKLMMELVRLRRGAAKTEVTAKRVAKVAKSLPPGSKPNRSDQSKAKAQEAARNLKTKRGADGSFQDWLLS